MKKNKFLGIIFFLLIVLGFSFFTFDAQAGTGTINNPTYSTAGFLDPANGTIKFQCDFNCAGNDWGITITDTEITGYAWGDQVGWIIFNPPLFGGVDVEVATVTTGVLSGYAWGQNTGWINFDPSKGGVTITTTIDDSEFNGYAWSENYGWIKFDCSAAGILAGQCVKTDWQPTLGGGGGGDDGDEIITDVCPNIPGNQSSIPAGYILQNGQCVLPSPPTPTDLCPNDPGIQTTLPCVTPTFCQLNPTDPSCVTPTFCQLNPTDPSCVTQTFCQLNPADPSCVIPPPTPPPNPPPTPPPIPPPTPPTNPPTTVYQPPVVFQSPIIKFLEKIFTPPQIKKINIGLKTAVITSAVAGIGVSLGTIMLLNPLATPELVLIPFRLWSLLLTALGLKKRIKPWGVVYDSVTKQPLDPVYVSLRNLKGEEVSSAITDIDGRYGFLVPPGVYKVVPRKTNYVFPSEELSKHFHDEFYQDLYFGDYLNISEGEAVAKNIPLDPLNFDWNEFAKNKKQLFKFYSKKEVLFARISNYLFSIGIALATVALLIVPEPYNIIIFGLYILLFILRRTSFKKKTRGRLIKKNTEEPLSFAFVRIFSSATNVEIAHKVADKMGRYFCLVPNGRYYVQVENKNKDGSYSVAYKSGPIEIAHGILNKAFYI